MGDPNEVEQAEVQNTGQANTENEAQSTSTDSQADGEASE